ncbi:hypothetical protein Leryth_024745 [Lithospermum erythrorhizon]|nr:hypothetical protein Leryth_024745 [Lithospermum erythrorhizon]
MSGATQKEVSPPPPNTSELRRKLREKWELASVLNFLHGAMDAYLLHWPENSRVTKGAGETVFEPVMKTKLKLSAEDIETGLIEFNDSLVQLHIALLKGITKSKFLDGSEAWVLALSRVLQSWWPWVAEGDFPLSTTKGEELSRYKKLDPTIRLLVLKSVCEVRATQDDIVSFINESIKVETEVSKFRKEKLADENGTAYWYDGNEIIGHRLYKEVHQFGKQIKLRGKKAISDIYSQWETVATNLEEFHCVMDEFASSELKSEVSVSKTLGVKVIPALEKIEKKKQRALKQLENQNAVPCAYLSSRLTRSSRNSKPISYTYDEYDKAIKEAIKVTQ